MHAIVDNQSGKQLANADQVFNHFKFPTLPLKSLGTFICEEEDLAAKIDEMHRAILTKSIAETQEGVILQLVDREENTVIEQIRIKSAEYELLDLMDEVLTNGVE